MTPRRASWLREARFVSRVLGKAPALDKAQGVRVETETITLRYGADDRFHAQMVEAEGALIASRAQEILGRPVTVRVEETGSRPARATEDENVERVKRVFRGVEVGEDTEGSV